MEMKHPHVRTIPLKCAPSQAPCPTCGKPGKRKDILHRQVRTIAYKQIVYLDITYGEYRARCDCCTTFRTTPPGVEPRALYDNKVREAVLDRILEDGMSIEQVIRSMRGIFSWISPTASSTTASTNRSGSSTCPTIAVGSWTASAARSASTNFTWAATPCCWPPTRSRIFP